MAYAHQDTKRFKPSAGGFKMNLFSNDFYNPQPTSIINNADKPKYGAAEKPKDGSQLFHDDKAKLYENTRLFNERSFPLSPSGCNVISVGFEPVYGIITCNITKRSYGAQRTVTLSRDELLDFINELKKLLPTMQDKPAVPEGKQGEGYDETGKYGNVYKKEQNIIMEMSGYTVLQFNHRIIQIVGGCHPTHGSFTLLLAKETLTTLTLLQNVLIRAMDEIRQRGCPIFLNITTPIRRLYRETRNVHSAIQRYLNDNPNLVDETEVVNSFYHTIASDVLLEQ